MTGKFIGSPGCSFFRGLSIILPILIGIGFFGLAGCDAGEKTTSSYLGTWKLEKLMAQPGEEWVAAKYPFVMEILANGHLEILIPLPNQKIHINGTWKILPDGRLQISQEGQDGETYERPSLIIFNLENGKLVSSARVYVSENEKAQAGFIFKRAAQ